MKLHGAATLLSREEGRLEKVAEVFSLAIWQIVEESVFREREKFTNKVN